MNRTEYMNTLAQELQSLPQSVIQDTLRHYEQKFTDGIASGKTEAELAASFPNPRLIAAQLRASQRFQHLKRDFNVGNFFGLMMAILGLMILNFFMLIPAFIAASFVFVAYLASLCVYGAGVVVLAVSLSGVESLQFKVPGDLHGHHADNVHHQWSQRGNPTVNISEKGIHIDQSEIHRWAQDEWNQQDRWSRRDHWHTMTIDNHMGILHSFYGVLLLIMGTGLLVLCLSLTQLSFAGFRKYLLWNLSLLRAPLRSSEA
ncbi:MAG: DUF1700 domain-containing protein [Burkholderiales bacterium]|nr:DUF1700 domain-containing protein [Burkholderiales bacterium]